MKPLLLLIGVAVGCTVAQKTPTTTPVPILKQVNKVNDDGSYTYGFEAADGSFKLETRQTNGEVTGKYGYVDQNGQKQVIEYNASKGQGFNPQSDIIPQPAPVPAVFQQSAQPKPDQFVNGINIALDGFSEDRDEDGFVDPIPSNLQTTGPIPQSSQSINPAGRTPVRAQQPIRAPVQQQFARAPVQVQQQPTVPQQVPQQIFARAPIPVQPVARQPVQVQQHVLRQPVQVQQPVSRQPVQVQQPVLRQPVPQQTLAHVPLQQQQRVPVAFPGNFPRFPASTQNLIHPQQVRSQQQQPVAFQPQFFGQPIQNQNGQFIVPQQTNARFAINPIRST